MKTSCSIQHERALTLLEVMVVLVVVALLFVLLLPALNRAKVKAQKITCVSNLKMLGLAFPIWGYDHTKLYPMSVSTNWGGTEEYILMGETFRHFQVMSNEVVAPVILVCPSDTRHPAQDFGPGFSNANLSYFVGVDANEREPQGLLAGDRNLTGGIKLSKGLLEITAGQTCGWGEELHYRSGNLALADGSVQSVSQSGLQAYVNAGMATNRLAMP